MTRSTPQDGESFLSTSPLTPSPAKSSEVCWAQATMESVKSFPDRGSIKRTPSGPLDRRMVGRGVPRPMPTSGHTGRSFRCSDHARESGRNSQASPLYRTGEPRRHADAATRGFSIDSQELRGLFEQPFLADSDVASRWHPVGGSKSELCGPWAVARDVFSGFHFLFRAV